MRETPESPLAPEAFVKVAEESGFHHLAYWLARPGKAPGTGISGVSRIFPPRGPDCPCQECQAEHATPF